MQNILIVDDIPTNIQLLVSILEKEGYAISFALDGEQALELIADEQFDLILLDVMMPGLSGFEICTTIKKMPEMQSIPIIFLTAKTERTDILNGFSVGGADYITKPFNTPELLARVQTHLELKRAGDLLIGQNKALTHKNEELKQLNLELQLALKTIQVLEGIIPICAFCKKIRDDKGYWDRVEAYITKHSKAQFSHSICPDCLKENYPDMSNTFLAENKDE